MEMRSFLESCKDSAQALLSRGCERHARLAAKRSKRLFMEGRRGMVLSTAITPMVTPALLILTGMLERRWR